jgi:hypothetical protein
MVAIMDLVVGVILVTSVAIPVTLNFNAFKLDATSKQVYDLIPLFLALGLLFFAGRIGGFIGRFVK